MTDRRLPPITCVDVDERLLEQLVQAALTDAEADDVTPPLTGGTAWTPARVAWLQDFHRARRAGVDGPAGEATWAVVADGSVVGAVRLERLDEPGVLEVGVWLTKTVRGRGAGAAALALLLQHAAARGAREVRADTTTGNAAAVQVLRRLGFALTHDGVEVRAVRRPP